MRPHALSLLAFLGLAATSAYAETDGAASDVFLNAYMSFQKGEKAEGTGDVNGAIKAYNQTITLLDQVGQRWPTWNPPIVKHRRDRAAEALGKLQAKDPSMMKGRPDADILNQPPLPDNGPLPPDVFPQGEKPATKGGKGKTQKSAENTDVLAGVQALKDEFEKTKQKLDEAEKEKSALAKKLEAAIKEAKESANKAETLQKRANLAEKVLLDAEKSGTKNDGELAAMRADLDKTKKQIRELQFERDAEEELRGQISDRALTANRKTDTLTNERDAAVKENGAVPKRIAEMQKQIDAVTKSKDELEVKLANVEKQLALMTTQRDQAVAEVSKMKEASKNLDKLVAENSQLMAKLADAEKQVTAFKADGVKKDEVIKQLNGDVAAVRKQLADAQQQSAQYQTQMTDLRKQLDAQAKELTLVKADATKSAAERERLTKENDLLRGIVLRAQKTQADKEQVKKLVLDQLAKLNVNSKALANQIDLLGGPVVKLTEKEKGLFKPGVLSITDTEISFTVPKDTPATDAPAPAPAPVPDAPKVAVAEVPPVVPPVAEAPKDPPPAVAPTKDTAAAPPVETKPVETKTEPPKVADAAPVAEPNKNAAPKVAETVADKKLTLENTAPPSIGDTPLPDQLPPLTGPGAPKGKGKGKDDRASLNTKKPATSALEPELPSKSAADEPAENMPAPSVKTGTEPAVPTEIMGLARDAKDQFERGNYRDAEKTYDKALLKAPNNLYLLSNKAVVQFRGQKYKLAEETFKKAIAIAPEDDFCHCTLGIVFYQEGKFDDAINELTKALAINPKNATAHNYLGITASQKGWQEAAQKELETAIAIDPNYADAHFNLAVVFATQTPPNKEAARQHYKRAIELGAEPDAALEAMIK